MNDDQERPIRMMIVYAGDQDGFYVAMVPAVVSDDRIESALRELNVDAQAVFELGGWKSTEDNVAVAFVPALDGE